MSVYNAAYPYSLGPGNSAPYRRSDYSSQHEPDPSPSDALVPGSRRSVGQDPHRYHTQGSARTPTRHPGNTAGYSDQYPVGNVGDYDPTRDHYHPIAPSLDSRVSESPMYHAEPYDRFSFVRAQYGQPPGVIAPYGVTGQPLGDYANQGKSLYEGQQSDDDYQRHNADRNRREGRAQDRFGQRNQRASKEKEYFLNGEGIHVDVLQRDICKHLGSEASVRPAMLNVCAAAIYSLSEPR